jgi:hypothetical protein
MRENFDGLFRVRVQPSRVRFICRRDGPYQCDYNGAQPGDPVKAVTQTTKAMLEEAEERVARIEAAIRASGERKSVYLPGVVETCLRDLEGTLDTEPDAARTLIGRMVGEIPLEREGERLFAKVRGNLIGLLGDDPLLSTWCRRRDSNPHGREPRRF